MHRVRSFAPADAVAATAAQLACGLLAGWSNHHRVCHRRYMVQRLRVPLLEAVRRVWEARPTILRDEGFCRELVTLAKAEQLLDGDEASLSTAPVALATSRRPRSLAELY
jgi:hypothetical protein